jgi:hypothetical protein
MGFKVEGFVGNNPATDGRVADQLLRFGRQGELIVYEDHGKFYEQTLRGNTFVATSATPIAIPIDSSTTVTPTLWNPAGSGVILEVVRLQLTHTITTPDIPGAMHWSYTLNAGAEPGTAGVITAFTNIAPVSCLLGSGRISKGRYMQAGTFAAAPTFYMGAGISSDTWTAASTYPPFLIQVDYDGMLLVPPGTALSLMSTVATGGTFFVNMFYIESPYSGMGA